MQKNLIFFFKHRWNWERTHYKPLPWLANPQVGRKGSLILIFPKHTAKNLMRRQTKEK